MHMWVHASVDKFLQGCLSMVGIALADGHQFIGILCHKMDFVVGSMVQDNAEWVWGASVMPQTPLYHHLHH